MLAKLETVLLHFPTFHCGCRQVYFSKPDPRYTGDLMSIGERNAGILQKYVAVSYPDAPHIIIPSHIGEQNKRLLCCRHTNKHTSID